VQLYSCSHQSCPSRLAQGSSNHTLPLTCHATLALADALKLPSAKLAALLVLLATVRIAVLMMCRRQAQKAFGTKRLPGWASQQTNTHTKHAVHVWLRQWQGRSPLPQAVYFPNLAVLRVTGVCMIPGVTALTLTAPSTPSTAPTPAAAPLVLLGVLPGLLLLPNTPAGAAAPPTAAAGEPLVA
jgi:hypothetical protein